MTKWPLLAGIILALFLPAAHADPKSAGDRRLDWLMVKPYVGAGFGPVHHTGYVPGAPLSTKRWVAGQKVFAGASVTSVLAIEFAYYHLGRSPLAFGIATEHAHAAAAALIARHPLNENPWFRRPWLGSLSVFAKAGGAYKWIRQTSTAGGSVVEDGPTYLLGFGLQHDFPDGLFMRAEYEYIGQIGTRRIVDAQHTLVSVSIGFAF